ncbi:MAG: DUF1439 domain-containing protein [Desulfobacterales bacterium]|nr:DUF1439 domain-containing protein [Desulfobacterales bacterium]
MRKKIIIAVFFIISFVVVGSLYVYLRSGIEIKLSQEQINENLKQNFPIQKENFFSSLFLYDPVVTLAENSDKVNLSMATDVSIVNKIRVTGITEIAGKIDYDPGKGEFYIRDFEIRNITISGIPEIYREQVKKGIEAVAGRILDNYPVYKLEQELLPSKLLLKSVVVKNKKLVILLGIH